MERRKSKKNNKESIKKRNQGDNEEQEGKEMSREKREGIIQEERR